MPESSEPNEPSPDDTRRSFLKQGLKGALLLPYATPTIESIFLSSVEGADDDDDDDDDSSSNSGNSNSAPPSVIGNIPPPPPKKPKVDRVSPDTGFIGSKMTVYVWGEDFERGARVSFDSGIAVLSVNYENSELLTVEIQIESYAYEGKRDVTVTNPNGQSDTDKNAFEVEARKAPKIDKLSPDKGQVDSTLNINIKGDYFQEGFQISFGSGVTVLSTRFFDDTHIGARIDISPYAQDGDRNVTVINPDRQEDTKYNAFEVKSKGKDNARYDQDFNEW